MTIATPATRWMMLTVLLLACAVAQADDSDSPRPQWDNIALGKAVTFDTPPNYRDVVDDGDATQLTDGKLGEATPMWYGKDCVG